MDREQKRNVSEQFSSAPQGDLTALFNRDLYGHYAPVSDDQIVELALNVLRRRFARGETLCSPETVKAYLQAALSDREHEVFAALWLDNRHRVLDFTELFHGTVDGAAVYPREVVKAALSFNAAACIFAHNHPSGVPEPSSADLALTRRLKEALGLVDVRVLDHVVVGEGCVSFAERGLL